jgi:WXG100 family type VII secretion target
MTVIRIDTGDVQRVGGKFVGMSGELNTLVGQAKTMMNNLQGQFTGQRAQAIFSEWEGMQPSLRNAVSTLEKAGGLLNKASEDFTQVDSRR